MRVSLLGTFVVMIVMTGVVRPAGASPISYTESVSGDLVSGLPAPTVFTLDVGVNTVSGTSTFGPTSSDFDSFAFDVPVGMQVTDISYAFVRTGTATAGFTGFALDNGNPGAFPLLAQQIVNLFGASPVGMFATTLPLGAGIYSVQNESLSRAGIDWTDDYTWSLTVTSTAAGVPEPASLVLLGSGLVGAGARRWRTHRKAA